MLITSERFNISNQGMKRVLRLEVCPNQSILHMIQSISHQEKSKFSLESVDIITKKRDANNLIMNFCLLVFLR